MPVPDDEQTPIHQAICDAMIASTPETWNIIELYLERTAATTQIGDLTHSISSPEGFPPVMPDDSLYDATYRLDELFHRYHATFHRAVYRVELLPDSWSFTVKFGYNCHGADSE